MREDKSTVAETIAQLCVSPVTNKNARILARDAIIDTLACMVAGRDDVSTKTVLKAFSQQYATGQAILVTGGTSSPTVAALINGTAAHALDYDDNFMPGMSHASAVIVPAMLAVSDLNKTSGAQLIDAYLAGLHAQALIGNGVGQAHYTAGWHGTSTIGSIGTAVAVARLLGLSVDLTAQAIMIAVSYASGTKGQFGTLIKPFHAGMAARNAVEAALLAQAGMQARPDILEGSQGFHSLFAGDTRLGWSADTMNSADAHIIETVGVMPKRHPCCGSTHMIVDALLDLMGQYDFDADDVMSVDALVGIANDRNLPYVQPVNEMQARFSMQYCVARALRAKNLCLADFTAQAVRVNAADPLFSSIKVHSYSVDQERIAQDKLPHVATVKLNDGRVLTASRTHAVGTIEEPFTDHDRYQKFMDCCNGFNDNATCYENLQNLENARDMRVLETLFRSATN
ncbi:MmgE/PrpD family protein [Brucellaceae bacterium C25G]